MKTYTIEAESDSVLFPKYDTRTEVFKWSYNGNDNQLPSIIQHLANESVTTKGCIKKITSAIFGKGFVNGRTIVNKKGQTLNAVGLHLAKELATQNNAFLHIRFDANIEISSIDVLPCSKVRIGSSDDAAYSGMFAVADWSSKRISSSDIMKVNRFNLNEDVIKAQIKAAGGIGAYKGQIVHISKDHSVKYAPSDLYPVLEDAESEKLSKIYTRNSSKFGFMNAKAVLVGKMTQEEESSFKDDLSGMQGAENASNLLVFQATNPVQDLEKQMIVKDLASNPSDKILQYTDSKVEANICKAFDVPVSLISGRSEGIFGNSGELLTVMKRQLYDDKETERMLIEETLTQIIIKSAFKSKINEAKIIDPWEKS
ncbi:hypothetical protein SAMN05192545_3929 [Maribacter dokdonensis]|uniref:Phage portal protein n=2 Tax=Maribacter dokdonensis TaxID=320912 RepID=A0ABY0V0I4_9FLAO|nr:hypothetical protein [Maribacter dokdonensis]SDT47324.1 hypothetical protein SAMN05192545_3929 [Maribacter dokdonensis]